jgi:hypothetical protein
MKAIQSKFRVTGLKPKMITLQIEFTDRKGVDSED